MNLPIFERDATTAVRLVEKACRENIGLTLMIEHGVTPDYAAWFVCFISADTGSIVHRGAAATFRLAAALAVSAVLEGRGK